MAKELSEEQKQRLPEDGDYRDWVLYMASENNWIFNWDDYRFEINKIKGDVRRVDLTLEELVESGLAKKRPNGRIHDITRLGVEYFNNGGKQNNENRAKESFETETFVNIFQRISDSINESKTTKTVVIILSIVPAIAVSVQAYQSVKQTDLLESSRKQKGEVDTLKRQLMTLEESNKYLLQTKDSLITEFQIQSKILDSTYQELIKIKRKLKQ